MPFPLVALGAAGAVALAALRARSDAASDPDAGPAEDTATPDDGASVSSQSTIPANLSARTLSWQAELAAQAPELDTAYLLRWIQRESDGNPAAVGSIAQLRRDGWAREAGLGQVYFESRAQRSFGVTSDELRAGAIAGQQSLSRDLTEPERLAQTSSLILMSRQYIVDGGHVLAGLGVDWQTEDIYCLSKLKHALPVLSGSFLTHAGDASSWDAYCAWLQSLTLEQSLALYSGAKPYCTKVEADGSTVTYIGWTRYINNAQYTGRGG